jgi:2'-5' RNA ligase superfamily
VPSNFVAIDVAILVAGDVAVQAREVNLALAAGRADALRLDDSHLPHVTLAQQFVDRARLDELFTELDRIVRHEPGLSLRISGAVVERGTVQLAVDASPDLQRLHELLMDAIEPFESPEGGADAFRTDGEAIRPQDVDWVRSYRDDAAYAHYRPHITVGHAAAGPSVAPVNFRASRVGVCELGRFCTCRTVLRDWKLA